MGRTKAGIARLEAALQAVEQLDVEGLRRQWQALYGLPAPTTFRTPLLRAGVAYKLQERALEGLKAATRSVLRRVADQADQAKRSSAAQSNGADGDTATTPFAGPASAIGAATGETPAAAPARKAGTRVKPGTRLLRSWQGRTH